MNDEEPMDPLVEALAKIEKKEKEDKAWKKKKDAVRPELVWTLLFPQVYEYFLISVLPL
jgi:hypothetical protein